MRVADRFDLEELAGSGAMGMVWRAIDRASGQRVAVKIVRPTGSRHLAQRFEREARMLKELAHPGIVRHVESGATDDGQLFLAMEWLEGEDLAQRLERAELSMAEGVEVVQKAAEALGAAHRLGIVHRDVKPANLFLVAGERLAVKVLDFGVARWARTGQPALTHDGALVGTPGYMSPEQGRGETADARADVFALGCVLFECMAGIPAFVASTPTALLLKILVEEVPLLGEIIEDVPVELEALTGRMLRKDPAARPVDALEVAEALAPIVEELGDRPMRRSWTSPSQRPPTIGGAERRMVSVVLLSSRSAALPADIDATLQPEQARQELAPLLPIATALEARLESLAGGSVVAILEGGAATDQAARAARCALAMREALDLPAAIATGRAQLDERLPVGPVIDRVAELVALASAGIRIDEITAGLLGARFVIGGDRLGLVLEGEREEDGTGRTLLGRPTPYVGRAREHRTVEAVAAECIEERVARAVLVTGPAGMGKSRLRRELVRRLSEGGDLDMEVWLGRGDPLRTGLRWGLIAEALHRQAGMHADEAVEVRRRKLRARVVRHLPSREAQRVAEFLGELAGVSFDPRRSPQLAAAQRDPTLMSDQIRRAVTDLIAAECAAGPAVLVLEDLQWADEPTVELVDVLLRDLGESPLLILAFARPEVDERFPALWKSRDVTRMPLSPLTRRASAKLLRAVLGEEVPAERVDALVERAGGNAFLLEELVRAAADGQWDQAPPTAVAVVNARLEQLPPELRRVLRAASVFGESCWRGGLTKLLGVPRAQEVDRWLDALVQGEWLTRSASSRFIDEPEHAFRHALIREAAYGMLTEDSRRFGHRAAAEWLEAQGERAAALLAQHYELGDRPEEASRWWARAAEQAIEANDFPGALEAAEHAERGAPTQETLGHIRLAQADAHASMGRLAPSRAAGLEALALLERGSNPWLQAARWTAAASISMRDGERVEAIARDTLAARAVAPDRVTWANAMARLATHLLLLGRLELAAEALGAVEEVMRGVSTVTEPGAVAALHEARARRCLVAGDRVGYARELAEAARLMERAGDLRGACNSRANLGFSLLELGRPEQAQEVLRDALATAEANGLTWVVALAKHNLGLALAWTGQLEEAVRIESEAIDLLVAQGDRRVEGASRGYLSTILAAASDHEGAEREARRAVELLEGLRLTQPRALAALAHALLGQGRATEALEAAEAARRMLASEGRVEEGEALIRLAHVESLAGCGREDDAREALAEARERLLARAAHLDGRGREQLLRSVPEHRRTMELAERWGVGEA